MSQQQPIDWESECIRAAELVNQNKLAEAAEIFRTLSSSIGQVPDGARAVMAVNLAVVYDKMGHQDTAIQTYEFAAGIVQSPYLFAEEARATYLHKISRVDEAIEVWESLLGLNPMPHETRQRIGQNLATAKQSK